MIDKIIELIDFYADPKRALSQKIKVTGNKLYINGFNFDLGNRALVVSFGKCAFKMAKWAQENLKFEQGILVRPLNDVEGKLDEFIEIRSTHPNISDKSIEAAKLIEEEVKRNYSSILFLISGGSSALVEDPLIDLDDMIILNELLIKSGASIHEINTVRKHLSKVKGGKLALLCKAKFITLAVSDVPFDEPSIIGSGPTYPDSSTFKDAYEVLLAKKVWQELPERVKRFILRGIEKEIEETPKNFLSPYFIILRNRDVLNALAKEFKKLNPLILTSWAQGESREIAKLFSRIFQENEENKALIMGGEPDVTVRGKGRGGRNSEFVLSFLKNMYKVNEFYILAYATDGLDGNSNAAGAWGDEKTLHEIQEKGIEVEKELNDNNTAFVMEKVNKLIVRGITGNNVNNVYLALKN
ncbi:MAG TPA: DUF4147 domain-containing protein [Geobacterales bacterium]|nr:DUF4147 domain-containing protein [Geobacterales bacterium]